jgi:hypothetical protein
MTDRGTTARSTKAIRQWGASAIVTLAATTALTALTVAPPADAAGNQRRPAPTTEATAPRKAGEPIMAIVSIRSQQVTFYDADGWILRAPVSTGTTGRETPAGVFSLMEKDKDHHSSLYDDAWMPNMLRITWSGIALHGGPLPGYAASHGCVRMPYGFAEKLFDKIRIGMRVIIAPNDVDAVEFSHPALFVPNSEALTAAPARAETLAREADEATKAAAAAKAAVATAKREAAAAPAAVRKLEYLKSRADAELAYAEKVLATAKTDEAKGKAEDVKQKAAAKVEGLRTQLEAAKVDAKTKRETVAAAEAAAKTIEAKRIEATKAAKDAKLDNAKDALDRITFPQEVLDRIAPTALPRSSLIISDEPLNRETNYRTEFVVVLNNQPQGGLAMRKPPDVDRVAGRNGWDGGFFGFAHWGNSHSEYASSRQRGGQNYYQRQW